MSDITNHSADEERIAAMVAAQAPRLFATVVTTQQETKVIGWGMEFDDSAYMVTADGRNQYFLAEAENALMYVRNQPDTIPDIVWLAPDVARAEDDGQPAE